MRQPWPERQPPADHDAQGGGALATLQQLAWLASGTHPSRIGWSSGPLTAAHRVRAARRTRPLRLCLLEHQDGGTRFAAGHAYWINRRSHVASAVVNTDPARADVVWVLSQDPLSPAARDSLARACAALPPGVPVLNRPEVHDAYHRDETFPALAAAGVRVPRCEFGPEDVGVVEVVYKLADVQVAPKVRTRYDGPRPGWRVFGYEDGRDAQGVWRRYRAWYFAGRVVPDAVVTSRAWEATLGNSQTVELYELPDLEREQIRLIAKTLGLDFFAVDYLRRRVDGQPVFLDINVYPTLVAPQAIVDASGRRGQWHLWDLPELMGAPPPAGRPMWELVDEVLLELTGRRGPAAVTPRAGPPAQQD